MSNALRARKAGADKDVARRRREKIKDWKKSAERNILWRTTDIRAVRGLGADRKPEIEGEPETKATGAAERMKETRWR